MTTIPEGVHKQEGIDVGHQAAEGIKTLRQGDRRDDNIGFVMPAKGPGVWELPDGVNPLTPWLSVLRPFLIGSSDQFRPDFPPDLTSNEWAKNYNEVKDWGGATSTLRTPAQSEIARFWSAHPPVQYNQAFRKLAQDHEFDAVETARLLAMGNMVSTDALIACFDAKYEYLFWRPQFAIPKGDTDGNPNTIGDINWKSFLGATPPHPEYPSAHGCVTAAVAEVLTEVLGSPQIDFTVHSSVTNTDRTFTSAKQLIDEVKYARIWGGIHYRVSTEVGADIGRQVARWSLKRYFLPEDNH